MAELPVIFFPGLSGDPRVFEPQTEAIPHLSIAQWPKPNVTEGLSAYAARVARRVDPGRPCIIGGVSFGGIVALEVAHHLDARACILIASTRDARGLPNSLRLLRPLASVTAEPVLRIATPLCVTSAAVSAPRVYQRLARSPDDDRVFRLWALRALLKWRSPCDARLPIFQLHGERDRTFPASRSQADVILPHAGHMLTLTHADAVNEFIRRAIRSAAA
ncbi:MAG: alpha/beta fold hydrolase [Planctomycetes bacterium]|nr:alpha/beta fold hydrolase [Planctomycetota bacterium]